MPKRGLKASSTLFESLQIITPDRENCSSKGLHAVTQDATANVQCVTNTAPRRHCCRARDASAPGPGRTDGAHRFHLLSGVGRTHSSQRTAARAAKKTSAVS